MKKNRKVSRSALQMPYCIGPNDHVFTTQQDLGSSTEHHTDHKISVDGVVGGGITGNQHNQKVM